jgi:hypothetical protein
MGKTSNEIPGIVDSIDCNLKCQYIMFYTNDTYTIANIGTNLVLTPQTIGSKNVTFVSQNYTLNNIQIYKYPTNENNVIHKFNGTVVGELIINHSLISSPNTHLNVCIPIQKGPSSVIDDFIKSAPVREQSTASGTMTFSLNSIIPSNTYYTYTSTNNINTIVFDVADAITIDESHTTILNAILNTPFVPNPADYSYTELFKSENPPINGALSNDIVIDCTAIDDGSYEDALIHKHASTDTGGNIMSPETIAFWWSILTALMIVALLVLVSVFVNKENLNTMTNAVKNVTGSIRSIGSSKKTDEKNVKTYSKIELKAVN